MKNKRNNTSENVLRMLKFILQKEKFTITDIINHFSNLNILLEQESIYKYIRTLKTVGFDFQKLNGKTYKLIHIPISLNLSEINTLKEILMLLHTNFNLKSPKTAEKLLRFSPQNICTKTAYFSDTKNSPVLQKLEKYLKDNLRLELYFNEHIENQEKIIFELHSLIVKEDNILLKGYNVTKKETATYTLKKISKILQTPIKNKFLFGDKEAIIKFYSKISKSYSLKDGEQILKKTRNSLIIKTSYYDEEAFFKKILRYVDNSEILKPSYLRENFAQYIKKLYQMYDCLADK